MFKVWSIRRWNGIVRCVEKNSPDSLPTLIALRPVCMTRNFRAGTDKVAPKFLGHFRERAMILRSYFFGLSDKRPLTLNVAETEGRRRFCKWFQSFAQPKHL